MCVMLRGALLPAMIMSKEIQEYSSRGYVTPFALFKISRDDTKEEHNMEYVLDLDLSYFDLAALDGKDLFFADPMNATGGSLVTIVKYLLEQGRAAALDQVLQRHLRAQGSPAHRAGAGGGRGVHAVDGPGAEHQGVHPSRAWRRGGQDQRRGHG